MYLHTKIKSEGVMKSSPTMTFPWLQKWFENWIFHAISPQIPTRLQCSPYLHLCPANQKVDKLWSLTSPRKTSLNQLKVENVKKMTIPNAIRICFQLFNENIRLSLTILCILICSHQGRFLLFYTILQWPVWLVMEL